MALSLMRIIATHALAEAVQTTGPEPENRSMNPMPVCSYIPSCTSSTEPFAPEEWHFNLFFGRCRPPSVFVI